jgi:hypothetical protein
MKDTVRIFERLASLQPGQSAEFSTRVFTPISADPAYHLMDRLFVNNYIGDGLAYDGDNQYETAEHNAMQSLGQEVVRAERQMDHQPRRVHYATQKIERRFSTSMGSEIKGVHSTLSITVYRVK